MTIDPADTQETERPSAIPGAVTPSQVTAVTGEIIAAYVSHNTITPDELLALIAGVHALLARTTAHQVDASGRRSRIKTHSAFADPDHVVCLDCGLKVRTLKRHIRAAHGMSEQEYRDKWHLAWDYPLVARNYSALMSRSTKEIREADKT